MALGGGGYDPYRIVPRAWSMLWAEMSGQPLPAQLPQEWVARWRPAWQAVEEQEEAEQQADGKDSWPWLSSLPPLRIERKTFRQQPRRLAITSYKSADRCTGAATGDTTTLTASFSWTAPPIADGETFLISFTCKAARPLRGARSSRRPKERSCCATFARHRSSSTSRRIVVSRLCPLARA